MVSWLAAIVALGCALASARRMWLVAHATAFDPEVALGTLRNGPAAFREAAARTPGADWERDLLEALDAESPDERAARVNEQLTELDWRIQRWARVPRVCASISSSFGFLLATLVLRRGLVDYGDALTGDLAELIVRGLVGDALTVAAFGVVGTSFCVAAQGYARRLARVRVEAVDRLVEALERANT